MSKKQKFNVVIDTDIASTDDCFALSYALASEEIDVRAITLAPFKNKIRDVSIEENQMDAKFEVLRILSLSGGGTADRVFEGSLSFFYEEMVAEKPAIKKLAELARGLDDLVVLCTGALTNIANFLKIYPEFAGKIKVVWIGTGNLLLDRFDDNNYVSDKKAFEYVLKSGVNISVIPVYVARQFVAGAYELEKGITKSDIGKYLAESLKTADSYDIRAGKKTIFDIVVVGYLLYPDKFSAKMISVNDLLKEQTKPQKEILINYVFDLKHGMFVWKDFVSKISAVEYSSKNNMFFVSDTHFSQQSKVSRKQVPFKTIEECDRELVSNWNSVISKNDTVYHLGDFGNYEKIKELNGKVTLICGNYEALDMADDFEGFRERLILLGFADVVKKGMFLPRSVLGENVYLVHKPSDHSKKKGVFTIFGHVHDLTPFKPFGFNVCVTYHGFKPISLSQAKRLMDFVKNHTDKDVLA